MVEGIPEDVVDHTLECGGCITESKRYDSVFEKAVSATERRLPFVSFLNPDEVVAVLEVDLVEVFGSSNSFLKLIHIWKGLTVGYGDLVDCSVVNAQS